MLFDDDFIEFDNDLDTEIESSNETKNTLEWFLLISIVIGLIYLLFVNS